MNRAPRTLSISCHPGIRLQPLVLLFAIFFVHGGVAAQQGAPAGPVPVEALAARRAALLRSIGSGVAVVRAAEVPENARYREDSDFFYLTGLEAPGATLVLRASAGAGAEALLYLPARDLRGEQWTGARPGRREAAALSGIAEVRDTAAFGRDLAALQQQPAPPVLWSRSGQGAGSWPRVRDLGPVLAQLRSLKDAEELRRLRRAAAITVAAHRTALEVLRPGAWEYEVDAAIEYTFRRSGAERAGFPGIVGSGPNSTVLHYDRNRRRMEAGDLVVVDVGAEYGYYTADVTRTYPVSGTFTPRQRAIYELVMGAQEAALAAVRPGVAPEQLAALAREHMRLHSGTLCGEQTCAAYFVHGLSHHIGLDVHDPAPPGVLRAGMVITIEPGIYLPDEQLGVRIEDDVLVTETGAELLTGALPRRAADVERALAEAGQRRQRAEPAGNH